MNKRTVLILLFVFAILGYFARLWVDAWIPGQMVKSMPELDEIYEQSAMLKDSIRNPVIVIPGMMGSKLRTSNGRTIWGVFDKKSINPDSEEDVRLLCCLIDGANLSEFDDGLTRDAEFTDNALYLLLEDPTKSSASRLLQ